MRCCAVACSVLLSFASSGCVLPVSCDCGSDAECTDGDPCNGQETCDATCVCVNGEPLHGLPDHPECTPLPDVGVGLGNPCTEDRDCDDGDPANGPERCLGGVCLRVDSPLQPGSP